MCTHYSERRETDRTVVCREEREMEEVEEDVIHKESQGGKPAWAGDQQRREVDASGATL